MLVLQQKGYVFFGAWLMPRTFFIVKEAFPMRKEPRKGSAKRCEFGKAGAARTPFAGRLTL